MLKSYSISHGDRESDVGDLALVELTQPFAVGPDVHPIAIVSAESVYGDGLEFSVGAARKPQRVPRRKAESGRVQLLVPFLPLSVCEMEYSEVNKKQHQRRRNAFHKGLLCAGKSYVRRDVKNPAGFPTRPRPSSKYGVSGPISNPVIWYA